MAGFENIIGQEGIVNHIKNAIKLNKISHAYIINGEKGMGKKTLAKAFAMTLQCEEKGTEPCMKCHSCKQSLSDNHPDIKWITHDKPSIIGVDDIRDQINNDIVIKPYSSEYKIYIMDEAEKMNNQAQNALLKTIEEPPSYGIIILLVNNKSSFLQTILSRCVSLDVKPLKNDQIEEYLKMYERVPDYQAKMISSFAGGNLGRGIRLASVEDFNQLKEMMLSQLKSLCTADASEIALYTKEVEVYKENITEYLELLVAWFRDVLIYKATKNIDELIFKEEIKIIEKYSTGISYNGINEIFVSTDKVITRLRANVNFDLSINLLLMSIRDKFME